MFLENYAGDTGETKDDVSEKQKNASGGEYVIKTGAQEVAIEPLKLETNLPTSETIDFTVIYNKNKYDVQFPLDDNVGQLKKHLEDVIGIPYSLQKVMIKGLAKDERTLRELGVMKGAKVMVVGSKLNDVLAVSTPSTQLEHLRLSFILTRFSNASEFMIDLMWILCEHNKLQPRCLFAEGVRENRYKVATHHFLLGPIMHQMDYNLTWVRVSHDL
ncbi:Ubiquitin domain-containing protein ubfd1 [Homalodisca vitripennis]|nr:Ubiquitin domain-containing protein ubfd1 [Homalodisca vitripennis]